MTIPTVTVTGSYEDAEGNPSSGTVTFKLNTPLQDSTDPEVTVTRTPVVATLVAGSFTQELAATSGGDIEPAGALYTVTEQITGSRTRRRKVAFPSSAATVDMADVLPVDDTGVVWEPVSGYVRVGETVVNVAAYGTPAGSDDNAIVADALADAGTNPTLFFKDGAWAIEQTFGTAAANGGRNVRIIGESPDGTLLTPSSATAPALTFRGGGDKGDDYLEIAHLGFSMSADRAYDLPLVDIQTYRHLDLHHLRADVDTRRGTLLRIDSAYEGEIRDSNFRTGKWVVPVEILNEASTAAVGVPQMDTITFRHVSINGCVGPIVRDAGTEIHNLKFDQYKLTNSTFYATPPSQETTLGASASIGATSITVASATGIVVNDVLVIDHGGNIEIAKVTAVNGTTITLASALLYDHDTSGRTIPVVRGGICGSFGDGVHALRFDSCHTEGPLIGFGLGATQAVLWTGGYVGSGELFRINGNAQKVRVISPYLRGTSAKFHVFYRPSYNAVTSDGDWEVDTPMVDSSAPLTTPTYISHTTKPWRVRNTNSNQPSETVNVNTGQGAAKRTILQVGGTEAYSVRYDGVTRIVGAATGSRPSAVTAGKGAQYFDTTLNQPIWSDGSQWVDATGAAV